MPLNKDGRKPAMIKSFKIILVHVFFFGIVGSYAGGLIFLVFWLSFLPSQHNIFLIFLLSPKVGFIPAALTGFLYSITKHKFKDQCLLVSALYGFLVMGATGAFQAFTHPDYIYDVNFKQSIDLLCAIKLTSSLAILGGICGLVCAKLICRLNELL